MLANLFRIRRDHVPVYSKEMSEEPEVLAVASSQGKLKMGLGVD